MGILTSVSVDEISARGSIKDGDVLKLQRALSDGQTIARDEAQQLLALDAACPVKDPSWFPFLIEAITDFIVLQEKPEGYLVRDKAAWLTGHLETYGQTTGHVGLELLASVLERARWSPPSLAAFGLSLIKAAVVTGAGPLRIGHALEAGAISQAEINAIIRLLVAFGSGNGVPVTRAEADVLIDINKALAPGKSSPAWTELFVKAVGHAALSGIGMVVGERRAALGAEAWLVDAKPSDAEANEGPRLVTADGPSSMRRSRSFAGRMIAGGAGSVWATSRMQSAEERALMRLERQRREIITCETIADADDAWLVARLGADGRLDDNEVALLAFLQREAAQLPPSLTALAAKAMIAA
ncbi:MAG: hypothetical protein ACKVP7_29010 [Hyphomicrobiaceae bacterium]